MELTVDGEAVYAATGGKDFDPARAAVVFVHGAGLDHSVWALQGRYLAHHGRAVLAVDLPGHGRSKGPPLKTPGEMADWMLKLLDAAGVAEAALVGHSMGALAALETAARARGRITALALLGVCVPMKVSAALLAAAKANKHLALDLINAWGHGRAAHLGVHCAPGLWMMGGALRLLERAAEGVLYNDLAACERYGDGRTVAAGVRCPVLLLLGENDLMTPPQGGQELAQAIPGARAVVLENCGHMMMVERPNEVLDALRAFL